MAHTADKHLEQALETTDPAEKKFHIRNALQHLQPDSQEAKAKR